MSGIDWSILLLTLGFIVGYGVWKTRAVTTAHEYIKGDEKTPWWAIGLSVMATQASAITFLSTPGQAYFSGMGFVQFYFGLPLAIVIICLVFIPLYKKLKVYTAYEYLESRFDRKTRVLTAVLFLIQRGLATGITIYAPSIVLSVVLGWPLIWLNICVGVLVIIYTVSGGTKAVTVTQKQQMAVIFAGMFTAFLIIYWSLPADITLTKAFSLAKANDKIDLINTSFDLKNRYTIWTGLIGGTFLMLSYFGTDQSQVQRYLSSKSVQESQLGLLFNALLKVPMQFFILFVGVMVFIFYQFNEAPLSFNPEVEKAMMNSSESSAYTTLKKEKTALENSKKAIYTAYNETKNEINLKSQLQLVNSKLKVNRETSIALIKQVAPNVESNDKDYVFIHFILHHLPKGLIGLLLAVILSAAMSSTASELNALATTTVVDLYQPNVKEPKKGSALMNLTKLTTLIWGAIAILVACIAPLFDNLIQLVNIIGSIFYGNILGIFLIAFFFKRITSNAVFIAALITQVIIVGVYFGDYLPFLWLNALGCLLVIFLAFFINLFKSNKFATS
ncbi:sodium:solute symporter [Aquimarina agarilytica]|uniref:sodium:solute symporter n=1 Tax=Aquimarina agarilytica TaxID=1087449 RepID=UPI0002D36949|nr:sodium:solute symporter [Aquimarina agarilytica]